MAEVNPNAPQTLHAAGHDAPQQTAGSATLSARILNVDGMGMRRSDAAERWLIGALLTSGAVFLAVSLVGARGHLLPVWRWLVSHRPPEFWSALAAWVTVAIALGAAVFAWSQVREARRTREEQAQPNVVLYTELNSSVKQFIEIVVRNYGATPAYHVKAAIDPPLKATPNLLSKGKLAAVPIPEFPILAPGQEWRTIWDNSISRKRHEKQWGPLTGKKEHELTANQLLTIQGHLNYVGESHSAEQVIADMTLPSIHKVTVTYQDSHKKQFTTDAVLNSDLFKGTTWADIKSMHSLVKLLEKQLNEQNKGLDAIHKRLAEFGTEHDGIWIYGQGDDEERQYRRAISNAVEREDRESHDHIEWQLSGRHGDDPLRSITADDAEQAPIESASIGDWYIEDSSDPITIGRAWRIAFIKRHTYEDFDPVYELFRSDGDSIREFEGTLVSIVRSE